MKYGDVSRARAAAVMAAVLGVGRRAGGRIAVTAVTAMALLGLVVVKAVTHPAWLGSVRGGVVECFGGDDGGAGRSADRLHRVGRLGCVLARLEPARTEYLELSVALLLVALLVGEVRLLVRGRDVRPRPGMPLRRVPGGDGPKQSGRRGAPRSRIDPVSPASPRADSIPPGPS